MKERGGNRWSPQGRLSYPRISFDEFITCIFWKKTPASSAFVIPPCKPADMHDLYRQTVSPYAVGEKEHAAGT
jgi:hypothetical protein